MLHQKLQYTTINRLLNRFHTGLSGKYRIAEVGQKSTTLENFGKAFLLSKARCITVQNQGY